ncbi:MAG TPA: hypothetical protein VMV07_08880 [Streptosporangiaceae bacterium]|nr:hypothetical protein [Streptosporangiaceae bacterium]
MRALVCHGPGQKAWEEVPKPGLAIDPALADGLGADVFGRAADTGALKVILSR